MWRNNKVSYGLIHIGFHWIMAVGIGAMFALGLYMVGLGYYDPWYHRAPALHKSVGLLLFALLGLRLIWRFINPKPVALAQRSWERVSGHLAHAALYLVLFLVVLSGYFIAAANGRPIPVFDWFTVPGFQFVAQQEDLAGDLHEIAAWLLVSLVTLHFLAALKHHFIDGDATLKRMLWPRR